MRRRSNRQKLRLANWSTIRTYRAGTADGNKIRASIVTDCLHQSIQAADKSLVLWSALSFSLVLFATPDRQHLLALLARRINALLLTPADVAEEYRSTRAKPGSVMRNTHSHRPRRFFRHGAGAQRFGFCALKLEFANGNQRYAISGVCADCVGSLAAASNRRDYAAGFVFCVPIGLAAYGCRILCSPFCHCIHIAA